jgi:hypothetical protein
MNVPKHIAGLVLFIFIVSISVFIVGIVTAPLEMIPPFKETKLSCVYELSEAAPPVGYKVQLVSLDFINRESYTTLTLKRDLSRPAPERIWVATSFYTLERPHESWTSGAVEIRLPFADSDEVRLTLKSSCYWCSDASAPRAGYYARVQVSAESSDAAAHDDQMDADHQTPISVLVQAARKPRP